jgi:pentatricopeptide repeat protein
MQSEFDSGKNKECEPDIHTYSTILKALLKSNRPDAFQIAEQIFSAIQLPDTLTYTMFISIYARKGDFQKSLNMFHQMQSDFQSKNNNNCEPDMRTYNTILSALQKSNWPDAIEKAKQIFSAIQLPDTVC